ncbi:MAG: formate dehydrogenase accessory sulfurtransferase FdhD [Phaeodactylibacter sp.]|nr:formate dehydrogenase accessory sulfurtransferase FdhD [Phaeodactylibacter sp.]
MQDINGVKTKSIIKVGPNHVEEMTDLVACEEPLELKLAFGPAENRSHRSLAITMRTPGQDEALAMGFLLTEGIIGKSADVLDMCHVGQALSPESSENVLQVELSPDTPVDFDKFSRHFYTSSSCGVCGKASIEMLKTVNLYFPQSGFPVFSPQQVHGFARQMPAHQTLFERTGGIHAAAAFNESGKILLLQEDVGRHNAMDKLIGTAMADGYFPMRNQAIMVSGRLSFELVQKAAMAGMPVLAAVGAPSSLAIALAEANDMTLIGFLRRERFNIYTGQERIALPLYS